MRAATTFVEQLLAGRDPGGPADTLRALRGEALEQANRLTVPTTREEDWRFTDLTPLYKLAFKPAGPAPEVAPEGLAPYLAPEAAHRLVFVDGRHAPALSLVAEAAGITVTPLSAAASAALGPIVEPRLGRIAPIEGDAFRAINTAHLGEGAVVHVRRNAVASAPVHLLFITTQTQIATHPRVLIVAEMGAEVTVLEDHVGLAEAAYCVNAVSEIDIAPNARVRHIRVQREMATAFHIATSAARLAKDARYDSVAVNLGARISRLNLHVRHDGEGAEATVDGLALIAGRQLADTHSFIDHAQPHCRTRQLHKTVIGGGAHAVFNGRILVRPGAQLTDSQQESRNLLLTGRAHVDTKPQLEIFADDVKCAHGATVGQLDPEELFYLRSRGLGEAAARNLLTYAFAAAIVARIPIASVAARLRAHVLAQTAGKD
jgi:Fe-S cluster assembly protein SufD